MEDMDKIVTEVARKAVKEFLENLMNTERDVFLMENNGQKNGYYSRSMVQAFGVMANQTQFNSTGCFLGGSGKKSRKRIP